jgi:Uma2 family endonuclease
MVSAQPRLMTAEEVWDLDDDGSTYELHRGELVKVPGAGFEASEIAINISSALHVFVRERGLGRVTGADGSYILARDPDVVFVPDAAFIAEDRLPPPDQRRRFAEAIPNLVVEVISPSDRSSETTDKVLTYLEAGVELVWVVDPPRRIVTVWTPDQVARVVREGDVLEGDNVVPGFRLSVTTIFA